MRKRKEKKEDIDADVRIYQTLKLPFVYFISALHIILIIKFQNQFLIFFSFLQKNSTMFLKLKKRQAFQAPLIFPMIMMIICF